MKRSRDASFSPTAEDPSSPATTVATSPDADDGPPSKLPIKDDVANVAAVMKCSLPPHRELVQFDTLEAFDVHYAQIHTNRCSECGRNLPSAHLLSLHIDENHNPLRQALQERGEKTYACFLPDCEKRCSTPQKRRLHLIDKHGFPKDYNFRIVDRGIDKATSMLKEGRRKRISTSTDTTQSLGHRRRASSLAGAQQQSSKPSGIPPDSSQETKTGGADIDELDRSMSALRFVPASVTRRQGHKS
jgi:uncharacterized protein YlaI